MPLAHVAVLLLGGASAPDARVDLVVDLRRLRPLGREHVGRHEDRASPQPADPGVGEHRLVALAARAAFSCRRRALVCCRRASASGAKVFPAALSSRIRSSGVELVEQRPVGDHSLEQLGDLAEATSEVGRVTHGPEPARPTRPPAGNRTRSSAMLRDRDGPGGRDERHHRRRRAVHDHLGRLPRRRLARRLSGVPRPGVPRGLRRLAGQVQEPVQGPGRQPTAAQLGQRDAQLPAGGRRHRGRGRVPQHRPAVLPELRALRQAAQRPRSTATAGRGCTPTTAGWSTGAASSPSGAPASARSSSTTSTTPSRTCAGSRSTASAAASSCPTSPPDVKWVKPLYDPEYDRLWAGLPGPRHPGQRRTAAPATPTTAPTPPRCCSTSTRSSSTPSDPSCSSRCPGCSSASRASSS